MSIPVNVKPVNVTLSSAGDNTAVAGVAGTMIRVYAVAIGVPAAATIAIKDGASTTLGTWPGATSVVLDPIIDQPRWTLGLGDDLVINPGTTGGSGVIWYTQLP